MVENRIVPDTDENARRCRCPGCTTYNECMKSNDELLFCSRGISKCDFKDKGCPCGACLVWAEYGLNDFFYCEIGVTS